MPGRFPPGSEDVMWQLFRDGPTWDGDLVSKEARDHLERRGLVERGDGWNWLSDLGTRLAIGIGMGIRKDAAAQRARQALRLRV